MIRLNALTPFLRRELASSCVARVILRKTVLFVMSVTLFTATEFFRAISSFRSSFLSVRCLGGRKASTVLAHFSSGDSTSWSPISASFLEFSWDECSA